MYSFVFIALLVWLIYVFLTFKRIDHEASHTVVNVMFSTQSLIVLFVLMLLSYYCFAPNTSSCNYNTTCTYHKNPKILKAEVFSNSMFPSIRGPSCF